MSDDRDLMDITPDTHFLESIRADRGSYWSLLAEGVDNSFDAGAREVMLTLRKDFIGLKDDGVGITKERQSAIVRLGEHRTLPTTMLGAFGIGLKYHAVSAGDSLDVDSVSSDGRMRLKADWSAVIRSGRWLIPAAIWMPTVRAVHSGTQITIRSLRWPAPTAKDVKLTQDKLSQVFYPALADGNVITLNDERLPVLKEPAMRDIVEGDVRLDNGKGAHVRGGLTLDPKSSLSQVQVSYKHRVIQPQSAFGCGTFTGIRRMFARVQLTGPWTLARFKNQLADNDAGELEDAVLEILRPVLEQCHGAQMSAQIREMTALLNEMLPTDFQPAKPPASTNRQGRRGDKNGKSGETKQGTERSRGPAMKRRPHQGLVISFEEPLVDDYGYGYFQEGRPSRIVLARDNPHIAELLELRDKSVGARALYALALSIYQHEVTQRPGQQAFLFDEMPFGLRVWQLTKQQDTAEPREQSA